MSADRLLLSALARLFGVDCGTCVPGIQELLSTLCRLLVLSSVGAFLAGCAIHPLPENVTGVDTADIVRQIRCESREAVISEIKKWLVARASAGDPVSQRLLKKYEVDPESISYFNADVFPASYVEERSLVKLFYSTGIAYSFDLRMTENNDFNPPGAANALDLIRPSPPRPKFTLGVGAGALFDRENERKFTTTDTFGSLLKLNAAVVRGRRYCTGFIVTENYIYPIAGRIGVGKTIHDFINLTLFESLSGTKGAPPTMTDDLTFTTTVSASVNPVVTFTPVGTALQLADASFTAAFKRSDVHEVTVGVAIDKTGVPNLAPLRSYLFSDRRNATGLGPSGPSTSSGRLFIGNRVIGGGSVAEQLAVIAIDQVKSQQIQLIPPSGT
jgi:hypothetical protein